MNQPVTLKKGTITFETTITGVSDAGRLLTKDVLDREFDFGEVELVLK
jgi:BirA family transcriptional regulator, biotin operon repressor / biotin---[acetyl-CoA-carboxylase] ligase